MRALQAGKHVLVEKPMAATAEQAQRLVDEAERRRLVLMVDHTFVYTGAVRKMRELVEDGLGDVYYYDSVRVNLGLFQHDVSVIWDLAVHDLSIMDYVLPAQPVAVSATGVGHVAGEPENIAYLTLFFENNLIAHIHVNWLAPVKMRRTLIGGSRKMIVYDDLEPSEKIKVYDKGITVNGNADGERREELPDARRLPHRRHVGAAARHDRGARRRAARTSSTASSSAQTPIDRRPGRPARRPDSRSGDPVAGAARARRSSSNSRRMHRMIPFLDLKAQYREHQARDRQRRHRACSRAAQFVLGDEVAAFEREFAAYCGARHGVAVNTGTSALHLALLAAGVGPGDEVITVPFTFVATVAAICYTGATPGVRRHRAATRSRWIRRSSSGDHAADQGDPAGASLRPDGRHGSDPGDRATATASR